MSPTVWFTSTFVYTISSAWPFSLPFPSFRQAGRSHLHHASTADAINGIDATVTAFSLVSKHVVPSKFTRPESSFVRQDIEAGRSAEQLSDWRTCFCSPHVQMQLVEHASQAARRPAYRAARPQVQTGVYRASASWCAGSSISVQVKELTRWCHCFRSVSRRCMLSTPYSSGGRT